MHHFANKTLGSIVSLLPEHAEHCHPYRTCVFRSSEYRVERLQKPCLTVVVETDDHYTEVVGRVVGYRVIKQPFTSFLCVVYRPDQIDSILILTYIPQLANQQL
jgi:hypothetical protein